MVPRATYQWKAGAVTLDELMQKMSVSNAVLKLSLCPFSGRDFHWSSREFRAAGTFSGYTHSCTRVTWQGAAYDFRFQKPLGLCPEVFKMGRKPFIHSLKVIYRAIITGKGNIGMAQDPIIKISFAQTCSECLKMRGGEREKEVNGTESKLWIPDTLAWGQFLGEVFPCIKNVWEKLTMA